LRSPFTPAGKPRSPGWAPAQKERSGRAPHTRGPCPSPIAERVIGTALGWPVDQKITIHTNADSFGGLPYDDRVDVMADRIKQEDHDVVVPNEVWDDAQKPHPTPWQTSDCRPFLHCW
jgi:hypothetical protein